MFQHGESIGRSMGEIKVGSPVSARWWAVEAGEKEPLAMASPGFHSGYVVLVGAAAHQGGQGAERTQMMQFLRLVLEPTTKGAVYPSCGLFARQAAGNARHFATVGARNPLKLTADLH